MVRVFSVVLASRAAGAPLERRRGLRSNGDGGSARTATGGHARTGSMPALACLGVPRGAIHVGRMFSHLDPHPPHPDELRPIHPQKSDGGSADRRQTGDQRRPFGPDQVFRPDIALRVKERNVAIRQCVRGRRAIGFVAIAGGTGQAEGFRERFRRSIRAAGYAQSRK